MKSKDYLRPSFFYLVVVFSLSTIHVVEAQEGLSLRDALSIAFQNNQGLAATRLVREQAENNNTAGEAGFLPRVEVGAGISRNELQIRQDLADGRLISRDGATSQLMDGQILLSWTLFDGLVMFARKERLESDAETARLRVRLSMENTVTEVISAYFAVRVEEDRIRALDELLEVDSQRVALTSARLLIGSGARPELLQARIEQNRHRSERLELQSALSAHKERLNLLMGRKPDVDFFTTDSITLKDIQADETGRESDTRILLSRQQKRTAFQWFNETKGARYPLITFNALYQYNRTRNEAGFLLGNRNNGPGLGFRLQWNLFDGLRTSRLVKNAELQVRSATLLEEENLNIRLRDERAHQRNYDFHRQQAGLDSEALKWSKENLDIAVERMRSGLISALEMQEAERTYQEAVTRCTVSLYKAKLSETEVLRLRGELVK